LIGVDHEGFGIELLADWSWHLEGDGLHVPRPAESRRQRGAAEMATGQITEQPEAMARLVVVDGGVTAVGIVR
jgi:hypothetical protein